jgi:hypothetical protein
MKMPMERAIEEDELSWRSTVLEDLKVWGTSAAAQ